ncbi:sporulation protein [Hymenobacter sp. BT664]|uniref:Sporulation protein n=1 Tax=Hymenobacter montanus TaxID=2771359 RepID=A0A927GL68_9BACT|nr:sporulation protein [Hymenobacter montanus]MBD2769871.1 sporulation protein [Hymenobacter montanus]
MSFFNKVKQFMGLGTLDVKLQVPPHFRATDSAINGKVLITAKSDQSVLKIELELVEKFETGRGDDKKEQEFTLGSLRLDQAFAMKTGESKTVEFSLPFQMLKSNNDHLKEKGGMLGSLGKMAAWASNEKSEYSFTATVDVQGASFDPSDTVDIKLIA